MEVTSTFDAAGQITSSSDGTSYTWDDNGQLTRIDRPGAADDTDLEYNAFGELVGQDHGTASTSYERDGLGRVAGCDLRRRRRPTG